MTTPALTLTSIRQNATVYRFRGEHFSWAICTVNDDTGELLITSDWGSWSHRWNASPSALGHPTLTDFLADRAGVDYLARKLQMEGTRGREFSPDKTAAALRRRLCERRLRHGREQLEERLDPDEMVAFRDEPRRFQEDYDDDGLPLRSWRYFDYGPHRGERIPFLTRDKAREIWDAIGGISEDCGRGVGGETLFYERLMNDADFGEYVTDQPYEYTETEQTVEDKILREAILPALIAACEQTARRRWFTAAPQPPDEHLT